MDLSRSQLMKATPVGLIAGGTGGLPRVNSPFEPLAGLTVPTRPVLILTQQLTPTAHDPFARRPPGRGHIFRSSAGPIALQRSGPGPRRPEGS